MKVVILAGGLGTRISEETVLKPKPMVEIGGYPILWHIMKNYSSYGMNDFIICCGYKGYIIKEYFYNYFLHSSDITINMGQNRVEIHNNKSEPWNVTLVDTGQNTMTGGRLKRVENYLDGEDHFCFTYGDGLSDVNINTLIDFHLSNDNVATVTAVQPPGRFGAMTLNGDQVSGFEEKPQGDGYFINGGFFVLSKKVFKFIKGDETYWEKDPMIKLTKNDQLSAFLHKGFWQPMDTLRDKKSLEELWNKNQAPWKNW